MKAQIISLALMLIFFYGCSDEDRADSSRAERLYDSVMSMPDISIFRDENLFASAQSIGLYQDSGKDIYLIGDLVSTFYDEDGNTMSTLYADTGRINEKKYNMLATGDVKLESVNGDALFTNELLWNNNDGTVSSNDTVLIISEKGDSLSGIGFESDLDLKNIVFIRNTSGVYNDRAPSE